MASSVPAINCCKLSGLSPGRRLTLGMRWKGTSLQLSACEQALPRCALTPVRLVARQLIAHELALVDQRPLHGLHAVVVVTRGGQRALGRLLRHDRDELAADLEFAQLVRGEKARASEVGLHAERAVELRRVPERLVDREP